MSTKVNTYYDTFGDAWTHGDRMGDGIHDWHVFLGPCPSCGKRTFNYGGGWRCIGEYCFNGIENPVGNLGPAPSWWNTGINVVRDGNMWMAHRSDFKNPMESPCEFGKTPQEAVDTFLRAECWADFWKKTPKKIKDDIARLRWFDVKILGQITGLPIKELLDGK